MLKRYIQKKTVNIAKEDRVLINGIYVGYNARDGKYIIQLVKPDDVNLPAHSVKNEERIEINPKWVQRRAKVEEISPTLSLVDRVSVGPTTPPTTIASKNNVHTHSSMNECDMLTNRNIIDDWNSIIGDNDIASMTEDVCESCDAWTLNDCEPCKRILFCLSYYKLWINHKYQQQQQRRQHDEDIASLPSSSLVREPLFTEYLCEFLHKLTHYSTLQMMNDFHHIKEFHINGNLERQQSDQGQMDIFEHFRKELGICNYMNCRSYSRNHRDRTECTEDDSKRRDLYFIDAKKFKEIGEEITETNLQQLFDMVHCTLLHPQQSGVAGSNSTKFITEVDVPTAVDLEAGGDSEQKHVTPDADEAGAVAATAATVDESDDSDETKSSLQLQKVTLSSYGFGAQFKYHSHYKKHGHKNYIHAKFKNLKQEVLRNKLYTICEFDYDSLSVKAQQFKQSYRGRGLQARHLSDMNTICRIEVNEAIREEQVVALMLYTNVDDLQREFKKGCRFLAEDEEKIEPVKKRNAEIANWCRLLWESINFYGETVSKKQTFYHGLNCQLLFNSVIAAFNCPTSTTVNKSVAFNFSTDQGIIVQLGQFGSFDTHYLDVSDLSDYPHEQERLFFQAQLGFEDIIHEQTSNKYFIKCLSLFQSITKGFYFSYNTKIFKSKHQKTLIKMMECAMDKTKREQNKVPLYMQQLFDHYCSTIKTVENACWLNQQECSKLSEKLRKHLSFGEKEQEEEKEKGGDTSATFMSWLKDTYKLAVKYPKTIGRVIKNYDNGDDPNSNLLEMFSKGKRVTLGTVEFTINKHTKLTLLFKLKKGVSAKDTTAVITVMISNKTLPDDVKKLKCHIGVFCPEINFWNTSNLNVSKTPYAIPLCNASEMNGLDSFEWKVFVKAKFRIDSKNLVHKL